MLGRIFPGRIPATSEEITAIKNRIRSLESDVENLPSLVSAGILSTNEANHRRAFLQGEINQLNLYRKRIRVSSSSYNTPTEIFETTKRRPHAAARKPANKYIPTSHANDIDSTYTYDPAGTKARVSDAYVVQKIPSEWQATTISENIDVPDIPVSDTGASTQWSLYPSHWPGNHSPGFMHILLQAIGEISEAKHPQVLDPRDKGFPIRAFSPNNNRRENLKYAAYRLENFEKAFLVGSTTPNTMGTHGLTHGQQIATWNGMSHARIIKSRLMMLDDIVNGLTDASNKSLQDAIAASSGNNFVYAPTYTAGDKRLTRLMLNAVTRQITEATEGAAQIRLIQGNGAMEIIDAMAESTPPPSSGTGGNDTDAGSSTPELVNPLPSSGSSPALMGMRDHLKNRHFTKDSETLAQDASLRLAQKELLNSMRPVTSRKELREVRQEAMVRKQKGANLDVNATAPKVQTVITPWQVLANLSGDQAEEYTNMMEQHLNSVGLSQTLFTQKTHDYVAQVYLAYDESLTSGNYVSMELVAENIASELLNESGLLNEDVKVNILQGEEANTRMSPIFFERSEPVNGLGGILLKTRSAMGRLLG
jgi:hypothetical protein